MSRFPPLPPDPPSLFPVADSVLEAGSLPTPNWWDAVEDAPPATGGQRDHLAQAADRLSLAAIAHSSNGGAAAIATQLGRWCLDLKRPDPDLAAAITVLQELDRLERQACEPQAWRHLQAAEMALAAFIASQQGRQAPT